MIVVLKPAKVLEQLWIIVKYQNHKPNSQQSTKSIFNSKYQRQRIFFSYKIIEQQKSEADLMLALNKRLQKARKRFDIWFVESDIHHEKQYLHFLLK